MKVINTFSKVNEIAVFKGERAKVVLREVGGSFHLTVETENAMGMAFPTFEEAWHAFYKTAASFYVPKSDEPIMADAQ